MSSYEESSINIQQAKNLASSTKHSNKIPYKILVKQLAQIAIFSSSLIAFASLITKELVMFGISTSYVLICALCILLIRFEYTKPAIHLILSSFLLGFTVVPFLGFSFLSGIIIYPLIISLAIFFLENALQRLSYALLAAFFCTLYIYKLKVSNFEQDAHYFIQEGLIIAGLFSGLFIVGYNYFVLLFRYQDLLEENDLQLQKKNSELSSYIDSNMQLENFAHLASHELKAPLKNIISFSKVLSSKLTEDLPEKEKEMLEIIENQASEMDELIRDLFDLSTVSNEPMKAVEVELPTMMQNLVKYEFFEQKAFIKVNNLPDKIFAHKSYIKEVFKNLISNALKFVPKDKIPNIAIESQELASEFQFSVSDNGIGIKEDKRDKVFLIFKRLHTRSDYAGTGIGLSICKKIIERHLGKIWIEDNPKGGTIFKFTIPKNLR